MTYAEGLFVLLSWFAIGYLVAVITKAHNAEEHERRGKKKEEEARMAGYNKGVDDERVASGHARYEGYLLGYKLGVLAASRARGPGEQDALLEGEPLNMF